MKTKLSYAWVRNTPLFKSVSTGLTFDEKHKLAVDLMVESLSGTVVDFGDAYLSSGFTWLDSHLGGEIWLEWWMRT